MNQHDDPSSSSQRTRRALILSGLASAMGVSLPALAQTTPAAKPWSAIEAAGAKEGKVVFYHNITPPGGELVAKEFRKDYPNIGPWLDRIKALPGWKHPYDLMPGHPLPA